MIPQRIQMSRQCPWRVDHPDAVIVDRRSPWGNPWRVKKVVGPRPWMAFLDGSNFTEFHRKIWADRLAVGKFEELLKRNQVFHSDDYARSMTALKGKDLACWCPIWDDDTPCLTCGGSGSWPQFTRQLCSQCAGHRFDRWPCHADVLLRLANPDIDFPWAGSA